MRKKIILLVPVLAAVATAVYFALGRPSAPDQGHLVLYGNVDVRQVNLAFNVSGPVHRMLAEEGDRVRAGELLAQLEDDAYRHAVDAAAARAAAAAAGLARLEAGSRPAEIARAKARVAEAVASRLNAQATFERRARLAGRGDASRQALDDARRTLDVLTARLEGARQDLALAVEGPRREDIAGARAEAEAARATLATEQYRLSRTRLVASTDGIILTRIREPGAVVLPNSPVYTLALANPVWVRSYVSGPELGRVVPGMRAAVVTDSFPDKTYHAWVGFISPSAEFTPKTVETPDLRTNLVYRLRLYVDNPDSGLRQGMPVTIRLQPDKPRHELAGSGPAVD